MMCSALQILMKMGSRQIWFGLVAALFTWVLLPTTPAEAWKQMIDKATKKPLSWHKMPIQYAFDSNGLGDYFKNNPTLGKPRSEFEALELAFRIWQNVFCPSGGRVGFTFQSLGTVVGKSPGTDPNCNDCNTNLVIFITDKKKWTRPSLELAITLPVWRSLSGQIFDADILINAAHFTLSTQSTEPNNIKWDIQNTVTHEIGHMLGLDHSSEPKATMYAQVVEKNTSMRTLHEDDVKGICTIYPPKTLAGKVPQYEVLKRDRGLGGCSSVESGMYPFWGLLLLLFLLRKSVFSFSSRKGK